METFEVQIDREVPEIKIPKSGRLVAIRFPLTRTTSPNELSRIFDRPIHLFLTPESDYPGYVDIPGGGQPRENKMVQKGDIIKITPVGADGLTRNCLYADWSCTLYIDSHK